MTELDRIINCVWGGTMKDRNQCRPYVGTGVVFAAVLLSLSSFQASAQLYRDEPGMSALEGATLHQRGAEREASEAAQRHHDRMAVDRAASERQADERQRNAEDQQRLIDRGERYWNRAR